MDQGRSPKGFTLIEMLITVGILCILAAIAIPNALEAQTRSKVARVKNDLRVIATAIEAYGADHEMYPTCKINCGTHQKCVEHLTNPNHAQCEKRPAQWLFNVYSLTTPVAYLSTTIHPDPFIKARAHRHMPNNSMTPNCFFCGEGDYQEIMPTVDGNVVYVPKGQERDPVHMTYMYADFGYIYERHAGGKYLGEGGWYLSPQVDYNKKNYETQARRPGFYLVSVGPDNRSGPDPRTGGLWNIGAYILLNDDTPEHKNTFDAWQYDPSNGTNSAGDLFRYGIYNE